MKHLKYLLIIVGLLFASQADAATCFWVGTGGVASGGTYSTTNGVNWASSSNGANGSCAATGGVPKNAGDIATIDSAANGCGANTVTLDSSMNGASLATITIPSGTCTLAFGTVSAITLTTQFSIAAAGATVNCGSNTITLTGINTNNWSASAGTVICGSGTIVISSSSGLAGQTLAGGGNSYGTLTLSGRTGSATAGVNITGNNTFGTWNITGPIFVNLSATTQTVTNALNWNGSSSAFAGIGGWSNSNSVGTVNVGAASTITWMVLRSIAFGTSVVNCTSCIDLKSNNMNGGSITAPTFGSGGVSQPLGGGL